MNWGHKLTMVILVFVALMGYLVYRSLSTNFELVEQDYYKNELQYQQVIDATQRASRLKGVVVIKKANGRVSVELPVEMKRKNVKGLLWFYCAYDSKMDRKLAFQPNENGMQSFDLSLFEPGTYTVKVEWSTDDTTYYNETKFTL